MHITFVYAFLMQHRKEKWTNKEVSATVYLARLWKLLRCGKKEGSQMRPASRHAWLQEALTFAFTTCRALSGGQLHVWLHKSWERSKHLGGQGFCKIKSSVNCRRPPHLLFQQDIDPLQHPLAGELIGNVRLNLTQTHNTVQKKERNSMSLLHILLIYVLAFL